MHLLPTAVRGLSLISSSFLFSPTGGLTLGTRASENSYNRRGNYGDIITCLFAHYIAYCKQHGLFVGVRTVYLQSILA